MHSFTLLRYYEGEGTIFHFSEKGAQRRGILYHIFYMVKIGIITAGGAFVSLAWMGMAKFDAPLGTAFEVQFGDVSLAVPNIVSSYILFILIDIMKDAVCMNVLHQIMHRRWYGEYRCVTECQCQTATQTRFQSNRNFHAELHYVHHLPMKEISMVNFTFFDVADAVLENLIGPVFILLIKFLVSQGLALC